MTKLMKWFNTLKKWWSLLNLHTLVAKTIFHIVTALKSDSRCLHINIHIIKKTIQNHVSIALLQKQNTVNADFTFICICRYQPDRSGTGGVNSAEIAFL